MDKVLVRWLDPAINSGWEPVDKYDKPLLTPCEAVGFLVRETLEYLIVALAISDDMVNGVLILPRPCLLSLDRL